MQAAKITGYRYVVCLVEHRLEKLRVRIDGPQLMESPDSFVEVLFSDLEGGKAPADAGNPEGRTGLYFRL